MGHFTTFFLYLTTFPALGSEYYIFCLLGAAVAFVLNRVRKLRVLFKSGLGSQTLSGSIMSKHWSIYFQIFSEIFTIILQVDECLDNFNFDLAVKFCEKALEIEPDNVEVLEVAGAVYLETGESDKAKTVSLC